MLTGQPASLPVSAPPPFLGWALWLPVAAALLVSAIAAVVIHPVRAPDPDLRGPHQAASAYAQALVEEHFAEAQQMFCARDKAAISPASLAEHFFRPELTGFRVDGVSVIGSEGTAVARAAVRFTAVHGHQNPTDLALVKENGIWRPCP